MSNLENITINTHSSIRIGGSQILYFDPFEVQEESHDADMIFVTHEHYDHFQPESIAKVKNEHTILVAPESMRQKALAESGIPEENCRFCKPGSILELGDIMAQVVPAYNEGKPFHPKENNWMGYVVQMDGMTYYVAGDTDLTEEAKQVNCDIALIPIGGHYTMNAKEAARLMHFIKPQVAIPTHYGTVVGDYAFGQEFVSHMKSEAPQVLVELKLVP